MSTNLQYLMLITLLFDPYNAYFVTTNKSKPLFVKSKFKVGLYNLRRFYKEHFISFIIFLIVSTIMCFGNHTLIIYFIYLLFLPLIIPLTNHVCHISYLFLSPFLFSLFKCHYLVPSLFLLNYLYFYTRTPEYASFDINRQALNLFRYIMPVLFIVWFLLENYSHTLFQQILIIGMFVMVVALESSLTETKSLLDASKNRYIIWQLKEKSFNLNFLSNKCKHTVYQQLFMIVYLSIIISFITKDYFIILIIILASIYLLMAEFDKMIQYKFFNQSILYDDFISRFIFSQIVLSAISFYLLYLGLEEVISFKNIVVPYFSYIKYIFVLWYGLWIYFFYKRFNKNISFEFLKVPLIMCLFTLSACSNQNTEAFTVVEESITFTGNMVHLDKQEFMIEDENNITLNVKHGDKVKKDDVLYSLYDPSSNNEIKRLNFQIEQTNKQINEIKSKIENEEDDIIKSDLKNQIDNLNHEVEILLFDKNLINTNKTFTAKFDGQVYLKEGVLQVFSNDLVLNLELNEHEYRNFNEFKKFEIMSLDEQTITTSKDFIIHFLEDAYIITFDNFDHDCYVNQTLLIKPSTPLLFVPETYVRKDDKNLLVKTESTEVIIKAKYDELKKGYYVKKGIEEGDELYSYEKDN